MQTCRDAQIVEWLGRIGAAGAEHVGERFGMSCSAAHGRLRSLRRDGLVGHRQLLHRHPGMYVATRAGLRWQGLSRLSTVSLSPATFNHAWHTAATAAALHGALPQWKVLSERELRVWEADENEMIVSARLGSEGGRGVRHRADLALVSPSGRVAVVEVELSTKTPAQLEKIARGWARARHVDHVYYLAASRPSRSVRRAAVSTKTEDRITVLELHDVPGLAAREQARERLIEQAGGVPQPVGRAALDALSI